MSIVSELEKLEDKFFGEWEEDKKPLIDALKEIHRREGEDGDAFNRFLVQVAPMFGGAYIPYLFWDKLSFFQENPDERLYIQQLLKNFVDSDFEEEEQVLMKALIVVYFYQEKDFETNKIKSLVIDKAHPSVREYFHKLLSFVEKNQKATEMYNEKFILLKNIFPNFDMMNLPITQLREKLKA